MRKFCPVAAILLLCVLLVNPARAQLLYGSLVGNAVDQSGARVAKAEVEIRDEAVNYVRRSATDDQGSYTFSSIPPGLYRVKVTASGFAEFVRAGVRVEADSTVRIDAQLHLTGVVSTLTITEKQDAAVLQTDRPAVKHELEAGELEEMPVGVGTNYQWLLRTLPGFEPRDDVAEEPRMGGDNPGRSRLFIVNGVSSSNISTNIDGASNQHIWSVGNAAIIPNIESIQVVNVTTSTFDAEQGLAGAASINVQIKSGTNKLHGSAFERNYNQRLRAGNYFAPVGEQQSKYISNQFGATLGGPLRRDKLFYFVSFEARTERENQGSILSLPSAIARSGELAALGNTVYDPLTGSADGAGRVAFPDNRIPAARISPIVQKIFQLLPLPNIPGQITTESNNFYATGPFRSNRESVDSKFNWNAHQNFNMFVGWSFYRWRTNNQTAYGSAMDGPTIASGNPGETWGFNTRLSLGANYNIRPSLLADVFFGWTRMAPFGEQPGIGKNWGSEYLGIPGTNGPKHFQSGWPWFTISNYAAIGSALATFPFSRRDNQYSLRSNFTKVRNRHEARWGVDISSEQMNHVQPEFQGGQSMGARGRFNFTGGVTARCSTPDGAGGCRTTTTNGRGNSLAAFLLGLPASLGKNLMVESPLTTRARRYGLYARDRWNMTSKLTLSYGVRWEYFPMPTRANRGLERYDPAINKMLVGGVGDVPETLGIHESKRLFSPRAGLAWRLGRTTVLRTGYGINFDPYSLARPLRGNVPAIIELVVPQPNTLTPAGRLADGIPAIAVPDLGSGIIDVPGNVTTNTIPRDIHRGYVQSWNFTLQRQLPLGVTAEAGYVATRQVRQFGYRELNWGAIGKGTAGQQLNAKYGRTANTREVGAIGGSHYDSLQARLDRRFSRNLSGSVGYTFAKGISTSGLSASDSALLIPIPEYYALNRSVNPYIRRQNLQIRNSLAFPFGPGQRWLRSGLLAKLTGGWQANSVVSVVSGRPFNVTASATSLNASGSTQRADQIKPAVEILGGVGTGNSWFDPLAYAPVTQARFGTAGFYSLVGPGRFNWDCTLERNFRIKEKYRLQFRVESFNLTNTPKYGNPGGNVSNMSLNPDGTVRSLGGFTEITSATDPRRFCLNMRLSF